MPHTSDNDKKKKDNNALHHEKNLQHEKALANSPKKSCSKKSDHL